jgi:hypothetical protein
MTAADVVTRQVDAYNAADLDGFLAWVVDEEHVTVEGLDVRAVVAH